MKKVGKSTRPFRYDRNQTPYDSTVEVTNRFNILDLIDRMPDELWTEVCNIVQESEIAVAQSCLTCRTPWIVAYQAPVSMGVSRQEYWTGLPVPSP